MTSLGKEMGGVLKCVMFLRILLFLKNISIVHFPRMREGGQLFIFNGHHR